MASINISEDDFTAVAMAACDAFERGKLAEAETLDKIARKINAALSQNHACARIARMAGAQARPISWKDVPSVLAALRE